jgi:hypothetical protein
MDNNPSIEIESNNSPDLNKNNELSIVVFQSNTEEDASPGETLDIICCLLSVPVIVVIIIITLYRKYLKEQNEMQQIKKQNTDHEFQKSTFQYAYSEKPETTWNEEEDYNIIFDEISKQPGDIEESKPETEEQINPQKEPEIKEPKAKKQIIKPKSKKGKKQKFKSEPESVPEPSDQKVTFILDESKIDFDVPYTPEELTESDLNKMRVKNFNLNNQLYNLESDKAMGKISLNDFNLRKRDIIKSFLDQYHK